MHERPQAALFLALRELGYRVDSSNNKLPALIHGAGPRSGRCAVSIGESSQFASAVLLCAKTGRWQVEVVGENAEESPYVEMTKRLGDVFPPSGGTFQIEPDASSGSYFWAAGWLAAALPGNGDSRDLAHHGDLPVRVSNWPVSGWQIDADFPNFIPFPTQISREGQLGDSIMTAIVLAPFASKPVKFTDLGRLRLQECERVVALRTELAKCGARVVETGDTLGVFPSPLHGAEIETYDDHRMAMCFAILGLKVPGIRIKNPTCVKKTFPNFFQKLAAAPPHGLGVTVLDAATGRKLEVGELFAD
jgi:3-phosphoshikimate 1-carboxyvinyltransferase